MEIRVYTIKFTPPRWLRRLVIHVGMPVGALLGTAAVVRAGVPRATPKVEDKLVAADVKANLATLNAAVSALEHPAPAAEGVRVAGGSLELISNGSTPVISRQFPQWLQTVRRNSVGNYTVTFQANFFSGAPSCVVTALAGGGCTANVVGFGQFGTVSVATGAAGAPADAGFEIMCVGTH